MGDTIPSGEIPREDASAIDPATTPGNGGLNQRGGRIDIEKTAGRVEEGLEETFPASDAPSTTPPGYVDTPPPFRRSPS